MFGVFIFLTSFPLIINQILPVFITQRTLYEARERPSKTYSWQAFLIANILVEIAWCSVGPSHSHPKSHIHFFSSPKPSS